MKSLPNQSNINIISYTIRRKNLEKILGSSATVVGGGVLEARTIFFSTKVSIIASQSERAQRNNQEVISGGSRV